MLMLIVLGLVVYVGRSSMPADLPTYAKVANTEKLTLTQGVMIRTLMSVSSWETRDMGFVKMARCQMGLFVQLPFNNGTWYLIKEEAKS